MMQRQFWILNSFITSGGERDQPLFDLWSRVLPQLLLASPSFFSAGPKSRLPKHLTSFTPSHWNTRTHICILNWLKVYNVKLLYMICYINSILKRITVNSSDLNHQLPAQFANLARLWIQGPITPEKNFSVWPRDIFPYEILEAKTKPPLEFEHYI